MLNVLIEENVVINDFKEYLKAEDISADEIYFQNVNDYLMFMWYDFFDNIDTVEEREEAEEEIERIIYKNFNVETDLTEWDFEIQKHSKRILKNLDFEINKTEKTENGASFYLKDKNSDFSCWFDVWKDSSGNYSGDWNKYIFFKDNMQDMVCQKVQEDCSAFVDAFYKCVGKMEE